MKLLLLSLLVLSIGITGVLPTHASDYYKITEYPPQILAYDEKHILYVTCQFFFGVLSPGLCEEPTKPVNYKNIKKWLKEYCTWDDPLSSDNFYCDADSQYPYNNDL